MDQAMQGAFEGSEAKDFRGERLAAREVAAAVLRETIFGSEEGNFDTYQHGGAEHHVQSGSDLLRARVQQRIRTLEDVLHGLREQT